MAKHLYLPQLSGENISVPEISGLWKNNEKKIISGISDAILVDEQAKLRGISSIPDIWARPLLVYSALKPNSGHPLRKQLIQEWRGLLSLLALSRLHNLPVKISPVELDNESFSNALKKLRPRNILLEKNVSYDWTNILMISYDDIPVGAFSPATLVYTGTGYHKKLKKNLNFSLMDENGYLRPPLVLDELEYVGEWIQALKRKLNTDCFFSDQANTDHKAVALINELLEEWKKEIKNTLGLKENEDINSKKVKVSEESLEPAKNVPFLKEYKVYSHALHYLQEEKSIIESGHCFSDISLRTESRNRTGKEIVVISEKLIQNNVKLWNLKRATIGNNDISGYIESNFKASSGTIIDTIDIKEEGGMWIRPESYFLTSTLLKAKLGPILQESEKELNAGDRYLLPLKKEILDYYTPEEIKTLLNPEFKEDNGNVRFTITLPIVKGKTLKVEKIYRGKEPQNGEGNIEESDVPALSIFPNYLGMHWRKYYLLQGNAEKFSFTPISASTLR